MGRVSTKGNGYIDLLDCLVDIKCSTMSSVSPHSSCDVIVAVASINSCRENKRKVERWTVKTL
jgi:hypothetical protein